MTKALCMKYLPLIFPLFLLLYACADTADPASSSPLTAEEEADYLTRGMDLQKATFAALSSELTQQINQGGYVQAIEYCNQRALPLTDSMAQAHDVRIRRVSSRPRNYINLATVAERAIISEYERMLIADPLAELKPRIHIEEEKVYYLGPIRTQGLCIHCHGDPERDIAAEVMAQINELYPYDRATGYRLNDLRGMWSIRFDRE
jgi:hypothetical protein